MDLDRDISMHSPERRRSRRLFGLVEVDEPLEVLEEFGRANLAVPPAPTLHIEVAQRLAQFSIVGTFTWDQVMRPTGAAAC